MLSAINFFTKLKLFLGVIILMDINYQIICKQNFVSSSFKPLTHSTKQMERNPPLFSPVILSSH